MPPTDPGGLPEETYAAIAAYILQANGAGEDREVLTARTTTRISEVIDKNRAMPPLSGPFPPLPVAGKVSVEGTVPNSQGGRVRRPAADDLCPRRAPYER
jgi:hypothetical protein